MWILRHNNVQSHTSEYTKFFEEEKYKAILHLGHSLDLAPCDFWLFSTI